MAARREVTAAVAERYRTADRGQKGRILDELCATTRTMRIFSSAEKCRLVARRMSLTVSSALCGACLLRCLIVSLLGDYDEPETLS